MKKALAFLVVTHLGLSHAVVSNAAESDLWDLSLEELSQITVFSAAKKDTAISETASAIYIIREEDIANSPAKSVPELLREVPGVNVAQVSASEWAISIRGLNDVFSPQLLVLVDGRTVYDPFFGGMRWESEMPPLELIETIEIIRGPGGALWGANATNGIINIITRQTGADQKTQIATQVGEEIQEATIVASGNVDSVSWRATGQFTEYDESSIDEVSPFSAKTDTNGNDQYYRRYINFRVDGKTETNAEWNVEAGFNRTSFYSEFTEATTAAPFTFVLNDGYQQSESYFIKGYWQQPLEGDNQRIFQWSYTDFDREDLQLAYDYQVFNVDYQQSYSLGERHQFMWGGSYRAQESSAEAGPIIALTPSDRDFDVAALFSQVEVSRLNDTVKVTLGIKIEDHKFTGTEYMPSLRTLWHINSNHTLWGGISRTIREPTPWNVDRNIFQVFVAAGPTALSVESVPGEDVDAEKVLTSELGLRGELSETVAYDLSLFYSDYENNSLGTSLDPQFQPAGTQTASVFVSPVSRLVQAIEAGSNEDFTNYGGELSLLVQTGPQSSLRASYSSLRFNSNNVGTYGRTPENQFTLNFSREWGDGFRLTSVYRYVDEIEPIPDTFIDDYQQLDMRLSWQYSQQLKLSFIAKNLLDDEHAEWIVSTRTRPDPLQLERTAYVRVDYEF